MEKPRIVVPVMIVVALLSTFLLVSKKNEPVEAETPVPVRVQHISAELPKQTLVIAGTTKSAETALLRFQVSGRVTKKAVKLGDRIAKGDVLATVYNPELEPIAQRAADNLARFEAQQAQAKRDFNRVAALFEQQAVTRQEWERARTQMTAATKSVSAAQAELDRANQVSGELQLIAPFAGSVTEVLIDVGEVVNAGAPAARLSNPSNVELSIPISDKTIQQVALGQTVFVQPSLDPNAMPVEGTVIELSPFREQGALPEIKIALGSGSIGPGVAVTAQLVVDRESGLSLPLRSVLMTGDNTVAIYTMVDGRAKLVPIRPLSIGTHDVVVDQGVQVGDAVITEGIAQLYDGIKVRLSEPKQASIDATQTDKEKVDNDHE